MPELEINYLLLLFTVSISGIFLARITAPEGCTCMSLGSTYILPYVQEAFLSR